MELFYHAVAILSCRLRVNTSDYNDLVPSTRQSLSSSQIASIIDEDSSHKLVLLPHVPYAISLSLSTAYRQIRHSKVPKFQIRARQLVLKNHRHLQDMSEVFWSAAVMAELARKSLIETSEIGRDFFGTEAAEHSMFAPSHSECVHAIIYIALC